MDKIKGFLLDGNNVYRTKKYIVRQVIGIEYSKEQNNAIISHDTFIRRTPARDKIYEVMYHRREHLNGKRLPSSMYTRVYFE